MSNEMLRPFPRAMTFEAWEVRSTLMEMMLHSFTGSIQILL